MENVIPVSDMRYYNEKLRDVSVGSQVILTINGEPAYAVVDVEEWRRTQATIRFLEEIQKGYNSLENEPPVTREEFNRVLGVLE